jgi:hypothetical protein
LTHCAVFVRLPQTQRDIIEVHQALGDPIDSQYADWGPGEDGSNNRIKLENVKIK